MLFFLPAWGTLLWPLLTSEWLVGWFMEWQAAPVVSSTAYGEENLGSQQQGQPLSRLAQRPREVRRPRHTC